MKLFLNKTARQYIRRYIFTWQSYLKCTDKDREAELEGKLSEMEFVLSTVLKVPEAYYKQDRKAVIDEYTSPDIFRGYV